MGMIKGKRGDITEEGGEIITASSTKCRHVLTKVEMDEICGNIVNLLQLSWLTSIPSDFGSASHGKLKADQWCVLGTTFLPVSLVHLWSVVEVGNSYSKRCCQILDVTMSLLSTVAIACSRVTSKKHADLYLKNMHLYLSSLMLWLRKSKRLLDSQSQSLGFTVSS